MAYWLHSLGQDIMVVKTGGGGTLPHDVLEAEREGQCPGTSYDLQRHLPEPTSSNKAPLLKFPQPSKMVPSLGTKCSPHDSVGTFHFQDNTPVSCSFSC
jgi:hypothetical protein